ncbi:type III secretion protein [Klebsiella aerogenes]|uniref:type III secretion protein n=1 Tax=Klebsiella aerogenes TaxID=548 RepID=UPI0005EEE8F9|nr:type III secretion protein [Klebsiella aerogenes]ELA0086664.1 type III secretion protein [Klebsiella aerogenes]ELA0209156.1 type III secretion protein [Klebsiella aerogenes]ELA0225278.1 type III secretion protein [Klebsiella aerogenes]ELA0230260.1 type III secretion protein [Klebsiella aerogenes]KJO55874.1 type III secretion protein [Klebsiella aerogenes]
MRADDQRMMGIMYAPASYTHISHLHNAFRLGEIHDKTLINFWLLRYGNLCNLPEMWRSNDATLWQLITSWYRIADAAHLIGGYLLRNHLPRQSAILMSDPRLLAFISLPIRHSITLDDAMSALDTASCGAAFILGLFSDLPLALRQRMRLLFPANMQRAPFSASKTPNHINLLRMALTYANHYY